MRLTLIRPQKLFFSEGSLTIFFYLIIDGFVKLVINNENGDNHLFLLGRGDFFGEINLFDQEVEEVSAIAQKGTVLLILPKETVRELALHPRFNGEFMRVLAKRSTEYFRKLEKAETRVIQ